MRTLVKSFPLILLFLSMNSFSAEQLCGFGTTEDEALEDLKRVSVSVVAQTKANTCKSTTLFKEVAVCTESTIAQDITYGGESNKAEQALVYECKNGKFIVSDHEERDATYNLQIRK